MNGKFCIAEEIVSKAKSKIFLYAQYGRGVDATYYGLDASSDTAGSIHLDYIIHCITREAIDGNISNEVLQECVADAVATFGGSFSIEPYLCTFSGKDVKVYIDSSREDYWYVDEELSSEEEYGSY